MGRDVWTLPEAWVTVWLEVGGVKSGDALLAAKFMRDLSLVERLKTTRRGQPTLTYESLIVEGVENVFRIGKAFLSKSQTVAVTNSSYLYHIEVSWVNPLSDGVVQTDDLYTLTGCHYTEKSWRASDNNDEAREEIVYDVRTVS